jgi:hypothetical protein
VVLQEQIIACGVQQSHVISPGLVGYVTVVSRYQFVLFIQVACSLPCKLRLAFAGARASLLPQVSDANGSDPLILNLLLSSHRYVSPNTH